MHNELKKNKQEYIVVRTNTSDSTRDSCLVHNNHTIKKEIVSKKQKRLVMAWVPALSWRVTYHVAEINSILLAFTFALLKMS